MPAFLLLLLGLIWVNIGYASHETHRQATHQLTTKLDTIVHRYSTEAPALPGLAVVITTGEKILYEHYSGFADIQAQVPVDANTQFYLKSITKSFLGLLAAQLHIEGKIQLNVPISQYLPEIQLPSPLQAELISLQSHFTHTLPYHDSGLSYRTAYPGNLDSRDFISHINKFTKANDSQFHYSNFGPIVGALALEQATGESWKRLMESRIFQALGMLSSSTSIARSPRLSKAYIGAEQGLYKPSLVKTDAQMHAAGGSVSTATDMARWLQANISFGKNIDTAHQISRRAFELSQAPLVQLDWQFLDFHRYAHGLGLYRADYEGETLLHHFGGETHMSFIPQRGLGIVILTNETNFGVSVTHRLASSLYDALLDKPDWQERLQKRLDMISERTQQRLEAQQKRQQQWDQKRSMPNSIHANQLVTSYYNERLGYIDIETRDNTLYARFGVLETPLESIGNDVYLAPLDPWGAPPYEFHFVKHSEGISLDWGGRLFPARQRVKR